MAKMLAAAVRAHPHIGFLGVSAMLEHFADSHLFSDFQRHLLLSNVAKVFGVAADVDQQSEVRL